MDLKNNRIVLALFYMLFCEIFFLTIIFFDYNLSHSRQCIREAYL